MNKPAPKAASPVTPKNAPSPIPAAVLDEIPPPLPLAASQLAVLDARWFASASDIEASQLSVSLFAFAGEFVGEAKVHPFTGIAATVVACVAVELVTFQLASF